MHSGAKLALAFESLALLLRPMFRFRERRPGRLFLT
jgi:hypothetical protein